MSKIYKCFHCGLDILNEKDLVIKPIPMHTKSGVRNYKRKFHLKCLEEYLKDVESKELSRKEDTYWDKIYKLMKQWLGVKEDVALDKHAVMRLKGLRVGRYYPNGINTKTISRGYSYESIYYTMKFLDSTGQINYTKKHTKFSNNEHMVNYFMKIIEGKINFIDKQLRAREYQEKLVKDTLNVQEIKRQAEYKKQGTFKESDLSKKIQEKINKSTDENNIDDLFL